MESARPMPYLPLNPTVEPVHYDLHLNPFQGIQQGNDTFSGSLGLECRLTGPTTEILLHGEGIRISDVHVQAGSRSITVHPEQIEYKPDESHQDGQIITIKFGRTLDEKTARLSLEFTGRYGKTQGLYRAKYTKADGSQGDMVTTDCEPEKARAIFPCIDNPAAKATYRITATLPANLRAVSNMPAYETNSHGDGTKTVIFDKTPCMSTYLVYLGAGEFDVVESHVGKTPVRIFTTPGNREKTRWALEVAKESLRFFEDYFGIPYMLPKLDLIAAPEFTAGAMENWGASTFREANILYSPQTDSPADKLRVAMVVAHEIAHQWFGDLVTMQWWDDLWLNESFADFMSYKAVEKLCADLDPWAPFFQSVGEAFRDDGLASSHPIRTPVKTAAEAVENFDAISYHKGAMVLRMIETYVGKQAFQDGVRRYLSRHAYGNAEGADLWTAIGGASRKEGVAELVQRWIEQKGYPVVEVRPRVGHTQSADQHVFRYAQSGDGEPASTTTWPIPLVAKRNGRTTTIIEDGSRTTKLYDRSESHGFMLNRERMSFLRVHYYGALQSAVERAVRSRSIVMLDRWAVHDDMAAFTLAGHIPLKEYLRFVRAYRDENAFLVLSNLIGSLHEFGTLARREDGFANIRRTALGIYQPLLTRLGFEPKQGERATDRTLRSQVIYAMGKLDSDGVLIWAHHAFEQQLETEMMITPDLRGTVYALAAKQGDAETLQQLKRLHEQGQDDARERRRVLEAMGELKDPALMREALGYVSSDAVRQQDRLFAFLAAGQNPYGNRVLWEWMRENWTTIQERYREGISPAYLSKILVGLSSLADVAKGKEIADFVKAHPVPGTERALEQVQEQMGINAQFLKVNRG